MGRTVISKKDVASQLEHAQRAAAAGGSLASITTGAPIPPQQPDQYRDRLVKYIPADVVAIYLALIGFAKTLPATAPLAKVEWVVFILVLIVSVPWQWKIAKISKWNQVWIGTGAFVIWAISLGDPFAGAWQSWYYPAYGTMAVALYTFLIPLFEA